MLESLYHVSVTKWRVHGVFCAFALVETCLQEALMVGCISPVLVVVDVACHCVSTGYGGGI